MTIQATFRRQPADDSHDTAETIRDWLNMNLDEVDRNTIITVTIGE
jgi:hypothetical protein